VAAENAMTISPQLPADPAPPDGPTTCRELLRARDWSRTSLGPFESWPQSLKSFVAMVLELEAPAVIFWGPDQRQLYNDGYRAIMGPRHPRHFGATYRECWPDTYPVIHPSMQKVLQGEVVRVERSLFVLTRHGFTEEAYFTFTSSPLRDDTGAIGGILQLVVEVTQEVLGERRAQTLQSLAPPSPAARAAQHVARVLEGNPGDVPFALFYGRGEAGALSLLARGGIASELAPAIAPAAVANVHATREAVRCEARQLLEGREHIGAWGEATREAFVLPVPSSGGDAPRGVLVLGLSPRLGFDERYRAFLEAIARELALGLDAEADIAAASDVTIHVRARQAAERLASELDAARRDAELARDAAQLANRSKDEFLAMLGHELRNPLAPIFTALELLRMRGVDATSARECEVIDRQARHLAGLVEDLLDVSRITSGKVELRRELLDLSDVLAEAVETASPLLEKRRHELHVEVPPRLLVNGDPTRLTQVFANLLTNAAKYTDPGGRITIEARWEAAQCVVEIGDTGRGIAREMLPRLFDLFQQERQNLDRAQGGLGLGLSIVKSLVTMHGGSVEARSEGAGRGSTFTVRLPPARTDQVGALAMREPSMPPGGSRVTHAPDRAQAILIVDDNEDAALLLAESLEVQGHACTVAHDGPRAIELARSTHFDAALLDIGLPAMDGWELARHLRAMPGSRDLKLVAITGYGQRSDTERSLEAGFDHHLVKPVALGALLQLLDPERGGASGDRAHHAAL
jgi:signal transduction histidine kinase/CheY-like chemotaxis protein